MSGVGDTLVGTRLARSTLHLSQIANQLQRKQVNLCVLDQLSRFRNGYRCKLDPKRRDISVSRETVSNHRFIWQDLGYPNTVIPTRLFQRFWTPRRIRLTHPIKSKLNLFAIHPLTPSFQTFYVPIKIVACRFHDSIEALPNGCVP